VPGFTTSAVAAGDRLVNRIGSLLDENERAGPMLLAAVVGTLTGLAAVGFAGLLEFAEWVFFDQFNDRLLVDLPSWRIVIVPVIGSLLVGPIVARFARETRGQGVSDVMLAVETTSGRIRARVAPMKALATATFAAQLLVRGSIYTIGLERRGVTIEAEPGPVSVMESLAVADAMSPVPVTISADTEASDVMRALRGDPDGSAIVMDDDGGLVGIITNIDLNDVIASGDSQRPASEIATRGLRTIFADQTLHEALSILGSRNFSALPVVERDNPGAICGILRRADITQAYSASMERRSAATRRRRISRVTSDDVRYLELRVSRGSVPDGHELSEVDLTEDAVVVAVRHDGVTVIPRGHTRLAEGDRVTVLATAAVADAVRATFERPAH